MNDASTVHILHPSDNLIDQELDMVIRQLLGPDDVVEVSDSLEDEVQEAIDSEPDAQRLEYFKKMAHKDSSDKTSYLKKLSQLLKGK